jgi:hypothetical protein
VEWFLTDQFGLEHFETWPKPKRRIWSISVAILIDVLVAAVIYPLAQIWFIGQQGWALFRDVVLLGSIGFLLATLCYLCQDIKTRPTHWWDNNFVIDGRIMPEL